MPPKYLSYPGVLDVWIGIFKSTSSESGGDEHVDEKLGYKSANEKKRIKRKKRKLKLTSGKEDFFKKPNLVL